MTHLQKLKSIRLCLSAHPDNEAGSEFEDRIDDLDEMIRTMESVDIALRDDFAKAAMQGILSNHSFSADLYISTLAKDAYDFAEALMQERERRMKG